MRKSIEATKMPLVASAFAMKSLSVRSLLVQAPPCTCNAAGNGPVPFGRYRRASMPFWYSTSSTVMALLVEIVSGMTYSLGMGEANGKFKRIATVSPSHPVDYERNVESPDVYWPRQ